VIIGYKQFGNIYAKRPGKKGNIPIPKAVSLALDPSNGFSPDIKTVQLKPFRELGL
jgi:hypothetical protein